MAACSVTRRNSNERSDSMANSRLLHEPHAGLRATAEAELTRRVARVDCDLEMIGAAEECTQFTRRRLRVGGHDARDVTLADGDPDRPAAGELLERAPIDVRNQVAEAIDAHYFSGDGLRHHDRPRQIEYLIVGDALAHRDQRGAFRQPRSEERRVGKECSSRWWRYH